MNTYMNWLIKESEDASKEEIRWSLQKHEDRETPEQEKQESKKEQEIEMKAGIKDEHHEKSAFWSGFEKQSTTIYIPHYTAIGPGIPINERTREKMESRSKNRHLIGGALATAGGAALGSGFKSHPIAGALIGGAAGLGASILSRKHHKKKIKDATHVYGQGDSSWGMGSARKRMQENYDKHLKTRDSNDPHIRGFSAYKSEKKAFWLEFEKAAMDEDKRTALSLVGGLSGAGILGAIADHTLVDPSNTVGQYISKLREKNPRLATGLGILAGTAALGSRLVGAYGGARGVQKLTEQPKGLDLGGFGAEGPTPSADL